MKELYKCSVLGIIYGFLYNLIEIIYRGNTHWSMWILSALIGVVIGLYNNCISWETPIEIQALFGMFIATSLEYVCGCIVNIQLGWDVWNYSNLPFNLDGQICLFFSLAWMILSIVCIVLDDYIRYFLFKEEHPAYRSLILSKLKKR